MTHFMNTVNKPTVNMKSEFTLSLTRIWDLVDGCLQIEYLHISERLRQILYK